MVRPLRDGDPVQVGPYRLHARLGGGGMGQVFLGRSPGGRTVAVKVVRPELADDPEFRRRFAAEVEAARRVGGFYTAPVVDADVNGVPPWLATAYIPGPSLQAAVTEHGPLSVESVAVLGAGLAEGLAAVHARRLVHRDLKPGNVILASDGPRLIDFGIARALDATSHTRTATVVGTAAFMSPEQARADEVGPPSDVFSLGSVLAFAATGRSPFGQGPLHTVIYRVVHAEPDLSGLPAPLVDLVASCLAKNPGQRPGLDLLMADLNALAPPPQDRPGGRWLPDELTEVITRHRTLLLTLAETRPAPAADSPPPPHTSRPGEAPAKEQALLRIGNLSPEPMQVLLDGSAAGELAPGQERTLHLAPGTHSLQVGAAGAVSPPQHVDLRPGVPTGIPFDLPSREAPVPEPVHQVAFTGSRWWSAVVVGRFVVVVSTVLIGILGGVVSVESLVVEGALPEHWTPALVPVTIAFPLGGGILGSLLGLVFPPLKLVLSPHGPTLRLRGGDQKTFHWSDVQQVRLKNKSLRLTLASNSPLPTRNSYRFTVDDIGAGGVRELTRLRAALRWFAGDRYTEQS